MKYSILLIGKIGIRSIYYYASTTIAAVTLGIILVLLIRPGEFQSHSLVTNDALKGPRNVTTVDTLLDLVRYNIKRISFSRNKLLLCFNLIFYSSIFRNVFPPNLVQACISQVCTTRTKFYSL